MPALWGSTKTKVRQNVMSSKSLLEKSVTIKLTSYRAQELISELAALRKI